MIQPVRLQLSRRPGANLRDQSFAANGLPAVVVSRPSVYGNPWSIAGAREAGYSGTDAQLAAWCSSLYREWVTGAPRSMTRMLCEDGDGSRDERIRGRLPILRGKNLACWCALPAPGEPDPCHAAVLLELANRPTCEAIPEAPRDR
ncbi:DUF4326 domain-containing protein [Methylobacterium sp. Gmos1]